MEKFIKWMEVEFEGKFTLGTILKLTIQIGL